MNKHKVNRYPTSDAKGSITATALRRASREVKLDSMQCWFYENYQDPAESTPYDSSEGGYIYIWGGPYDAEEELKCEFEGIVSEQVIDELVEELRQICWEWTKNPDYYDEDEDYLFESIVNTTKHRQSFETGVLNIENLLLVQLDMAEKKYLLRLLYINIITILETYLSDFFISAIGNDKDLLRKFIETTPEFQGEKLSVSDIFKTIEGIEKKTSSYLMAIVWHNIKKVKPMFKVTLDIDFPDDLKPIFTAIYVRHDLVHRNGKKKEGSEHDISNDSVTELIQVAKDFIAHIDNQWSNRQIYKNLDKAECLKLM